MTISDEKMAEITAELALAEGATSKLTGFKKDSLANAYFRVVFEMQNVTLEEYEKNLRIAASEPGHTDRILKVAEKIINDKKEAISPSTK